MNELRDPHEPVIPGQHEHPAEGHGGVSMPIGVSGIPDGMMLVPIPQVLVGDAPKLDEQLAETAPQSKTDEQS